MNWTPWLDTPPPVGALFWLYREGRRLGVYCHRDTAGMNAAGLYWAMWRGPSLEARNCGGMWLTF